MCLGAITSFSISYLQHSLCVYLNWQWERWWRGSPFSNNNEKPAEICGIEAWRERWAIQRCLHAVIHRPWRPQWTNSCLLWGVPRLRADRWATDKVQERLPTTNVLGFPSLPFLRQVILSVESLHSSSPAASYASQESIFNRSSMIIRKRYFCIDLSIHISVYNQPGADDQSPRDESSTVSSKSDFLPTGVNKSILLMLASSFTVTLAATAVLGSPLLIRKQKDLDTGLTLRFPQCRRLCK